VDELNYEYDQLFSEFTPCFRLEKKKSRFCVLPAILNIYFTPFTGVGEVAA
jgi:hypothetical protein